MSVCLCICLSVSSSLYLTIFLSLSLFLSLPFSLPMFLSLFLYLSLTHFLPAYLSVWSVSLYLAPSPHFLSTTHSSQYPLSCWAPAPPLSACLPLSLTASDELRKCSALPWTARLSSPHPGTRQRQACCCHDQS